MSQRPSAGLDWRVELPERTEAALGVRPARARLLISSPTHGDECLCIPKAVGRKLASLRRTGELSPSSRAELLFALRDVSAALARAKAEDLVGRRDYSSSELARRLEREGYLPDVASGVVTRFEEVGLIDDSRFADFFIRSKLACGWGRSKVERELKRRGVEPSSVPGWPEDYLDGSDEAEAAFELASRRRLTGKNDFQKLVRFLCGRGYPMGVSMEAARRVMAEEDA